MTIPTTVQEREVTGSVVPPEGSAALVVKPAEDAKRVQVAEAAPVADQPSVHAPAIMVTSEAIDQLFGALAMAQGKFGEIERTLNAKVESRREGARSYTYDYAPLDEVLGAVRPVLSENGIAIMQFPLTRANSVVIRTMLGHKSGQWLYNELAAASLGTDPQAVGSAITYLRRYALQSVLGVAPKYDDDGKAASAPAAPIVSAPTGYEEWLSDMQSVADEGTERLKAEWSKSLAEFRQHLTRHAPDVWQALKVKAAGVSA